MVTMSTLPGRAILGGLLLEMKFVLCTEWFPPPLSPPLPGMAGAFVRLWLGSFLMLLWIFTSSVLIVQGLSATFTDLPKCTC